MIVAGMIAGASGFDPAQPMARLHDRPSPAIVSRGSVASGGVAVRQAADD